MRRRAGVMAALGFLLGASAAGAALRVETVPEHPCPGEIFLVRAAGAEAAQQEPLEVRFGARAFALWPSEGATWEGLAVVDREETAPQRDLLLVRAGAPAEPPLGVHEVVFGVREYAVQRITGVDESKVTLSPRDEERTNRENKLILSVLAGRTPERLWTGPAQLPAAGEINGRFGVRREYNGKLRGYHNGVDIAAPRGAPVRATAAGRVALVGDYFMTGHTVVLDHGLGLYSAYFHLDSVAVAPGDAVASGATLGSVGSTGRSTGPHLHWGVYVSGVRGDPETFLLVGARTANGGAQGQKMP